MKKRRLFLRIVCTMLIICALPSALFSCDSRDSAPVFAGDPNRDRTPKATTTSKNTNGTGKKVALTFDDGPHNVRTKAIVDELDKYGFHATFFVLGNRLDSTEYNGASALEYAISHGNEIGIHGYSHKKYYDVCSDDEYKYEINTTHKIITNIAPKHSVKLMRPIGGNITNERIQTSSYSVIKWSVDSEDWKYKGRASDAEITENINTIVENVMSKVSEGDIILMHDIYENTYEAAKIIIKRLHAEGYEIVTVSELLGASLKAGTLYNKKTSD